MSGRNTPPPDRVRVSSKHQKLQRFQSLLPKGGRCFAPLLPTLKQPKTSQVVNSDGRPTIERRGLKQRPWQDLYHWLLVMPWWGILCLTLMAYLGLNLLFAIAYLLGGDCIANATPGSLKDAFFFSVQTMATIGYGAMYPKTDYAHMLVAAEAFVGLLGVAMATGLLFAHFSRPTARVLFSRVAVVDTFNGVPMLMFRAANRRSNQIVEARLWVTLAKDEVTAEGVAMRRVYDLKLVRSQTPFFFLSLTAMHPIDPDSPFYGKTQEELRSGDAVVFVTLIGTDETVAQSVHARHAYSMEEVLWNWRFVDVFYADETGRRVLDYTRFHDAVPLANAVKN